ncbi:hypothetical protein [Rudanella lutea]|uniref:hypothetical protein n=1 Tax=Rudanella lutea TaxID=451374 RepID=UPI00037F48C9|nr:hypothetical protein [Rudanella lutea]
MKHTVQVALCTLGVLGGSLAYGQRNTNDYDRFRSDDRSNRPERDDREYRRDFRNDRPYRDVSPYRNERLGPMRDEREMRPSGNGREMLDAYREGYRDGQRDTERLLRRNGDEPDKNERDDQRDDRLNYKNFTFGVYAGGNSTRFEGEDVNGDALTGRLGWQLGGFIRGGGRVFGQIGFEYLTSSNDFYQKGDGANLEDITGNIDQRYIHVPVYVGIKLAQSPRGVSAVRLQVGAQYAAPTGVRNNDFNFERGDFRRSTIMGLANLGFDAGPLFLDLVYQHGFEDVLKEVSNTKRRIVGLNVGLKF